MRDSIFGCARRGSFCFAIALASSASAAHAGVIAHWSFDAQDGNTYAEDTGDHNATIVENGTGNVSVVTGPFGNGAGFNNAIGQQTTNQAYLTIPNLTEIMGPAGTSFSVASWVNIPAANTTDDNTILADWGNAPAGGNRFSYWFNIDNANSNTDGRARFQIRQGTGNGTDIVGRVIPSGDQADDTWHHVAWTWNKPTATLRTYIDGTLVDTLDDADDNANILVSDSPIGNIGRKSDNNRYYTGSLDELWVFDTVLSDTDVVSLQTTNAIPEPTALGVLATGCALLLRRRRA